MAMDINPKFTPTSPVCNATQGSLIILDFILQDGHYVPLKYQSRGLWNCSEHVAFVVPPNLVKHSTIYFRPVSVTRFGFSPWIYVDTHTWGQRTSFINKADITWSLVMHADSVYVEYFRRITCLFNVYTQQSIQSCSMTDIQTKSLKNYLESSWTFKECGFAFFYCSGITIVESIYSCDFIADYSLEVEIALEAHSKLVGSLTSLCSLDWKARILDADTSLPWPPALTILFKLMSSIKDFTWSLYLATDQETSSLILRHKFGSHGSKNTPPYVTYNWSLYLRA